MRLAIESRKCITSSGLRITGSLNGLLGIGISSTAQSRLSVTLYRKRSAPVATPTVLGESLPLGLSNIPQRIACVDISTIQGRDSVGSVVTVGNGRPLKSGYRRFKIKYAEGQDDYAMMAEVVERYFRGLLDHGEDPPDLVGAQEAAAAADLSEGRGGLLLVLKDDVQGLLRQPTGLKGDRAEKESGIGCNHGRFSHPLRIRLGSPGGSFNIISPGRPGARVGRRSRARSVSERFG